MKIEDSIVPVKIAHLAQYVAARRRISLSEALTYIYSNPFFPKLYDENAKWWYLDTKTLYEMFERNRRLTTKYVSFAVFEFLVFCIERYADRTLQSSLQVMALFSHYGADDYVADNYDFLHTQDLDLVLDDIDKFLKKRKI